MVPRLDADPLLDALALHVPAGRVPVRTPRRREPAPRPTRSRIRARRHRCLRRGRYWEITADYAKASPDDLLVRVSVRNAGPETATLDVLPTLWFRNTWSWGGDVEKPTIRLQQGALVAEHDRLGTRFLSRLGLAGAAVLRERVERRAPLGPPGGDALPEGRHRRPRAHGSATVNPDRTGTKAAYRYRLEIAPGDTARIDLRLGEKRGLGRDFAAV